jgi:calreticulin
MLLVVLFIAAVSGEVYFKETFDDSYADRWVESDWKKSSGEQGAWEHSAGEWYGDAEADKGLKTTQDARFYSISSKIAEPFSNKGKDLVIQFQVKHAQKIDCGGGYLKIMPAGQDQKDFTGDSEYNIMFGPDICGYSSKKVHVIFNYKGKNLLTKKDITCETDQVSHVYTLVVKPDNTYEVFIDGESKQSGSLEEDWDFLEPRKIKDPDQSKPEDWVDDAKMDDPEDEKPDGWDDVPKQIDDPEAEKPDDWDDEADGEWEPPLIDNPDYKGEWKAKRIENPDYQGPWVHPDIDNPDFVEDDELYAYESFGVVGIDIWQVKAGSIFDNIIITDSFDEAKAFMEETYSANKDAEKEMFDEAEKVRREEEEAQRKKEEEERKAKEAEEEEEEDEDEEDEEDEEGEGTPAPKEEL